MAYAPRKRVYKKRWKVFISFLVLVGLIIYAIVFAIIDHNKPVSKAFSVCDLSSDKTVELLNTKASENIVVNDYTFYGESLGLYQETYGMELKDQFAGKTFTLTNLCNNEEVSLTMDTKIDQKLPLYELSAGIYDIEVIDNLVKKRIVFAEKMDIPKFHTVKRNGIINEISLIGDANLLADSDIVMDQNYAFIQVKEISNDEELDVYIDPYGMNMDITYEADEGKVANDLSEAKEMYETALIMKQSLEDLGLRVGISKQSFDEIGKAYGKDGRLAPAYEKKAKYYLFLRFNSSEVESAKGVEIYHSAYASSTLAKTMMYELKKNLGMQGSAMYSTDPANPGINASILIKGVDDRVGYDNNLYLRESGGRATFAGQYSENAINDNSQYAVANGMMGLEIDFAYISNTEDATFWKDNKDKIAKESALAFAKGIRVVAE